MFEAMPYFVFMEAMMSHLTHSGAFLIFGAHVSQFQFLPSCRQGWGWAMWATLMLNPMMPLCCVSFLCVLPCAIWTSLMSFCPA